MFPPLIYQLNIHFLRQVRIMNKTIKEDLKTRLIGLIDDNCLSIVMVQLTQLLNEYEAAEEGAGVDSDNLL